jgi:hypothetical protein
MPNQTKRLKSPRGGFFCRSWGHTPPALFGMQLHVPALDFRPINPSTGRPASEQLVQRRLLPRAQHGVWASTEPVVRLHVGHCVTSSVNNSCVRPKQPCSDKCGWTRWRCNPSRTLARITSVRPLILCAIGQRSTSETRRMSQRIKKETLTLISTLDANVKCKRFMIGLLRGGVHYQYEGVVF